MSLRWSFFDVVLNSGYKYFALPELENYFEKSQRDEIFIENIFRD